MNTQEIAPPPAPLPCPWCGCADPDERTVEICRLANCVPLRVACSCGAAGPHADTREQAIAAWNRVAALAAGARP